MKRFLLSIVAIWIAAICLNAQTALDEIRENPEKSGGVYYAYPVPVDSKLTQAPKGYKPFYISHYGRHGSRYMLNDNDYRRPLDALRTANDNGALTTLGKDVLARLEKIWEEAQYHGDELSPLGRRQHRGIAERMYNNYPEVFRQKGRITARSTTSMRVTISMFAFVERLHELNHKLDINWGNSSDNMQYLNSHTQRYNQLKNDFNGWRRDQSQFGARGIPSERFTAQLISDPSKAGINVGGLMGQLYNVAADLQNMEVNVNLFDLFTAEELYENWRNENSWFFCCDANSPLNKGTAMESCYPLLQHFIDEADKAIAGKGDVATLRFGHDGNIIPLASIMHLKGCDSTEPDLHVIDKEWRDYFVSPMGANIQLVFYKKKRSDDILVKILHNERETTIPVSTDVSPFYHWRDVKTFFESQFTNRSPQ